MYQVLTDRDIENLGSMKKIIEAITRSFEEQSNGTLISPPRFRIETDLGDLVFTAGAATALDKVIGFRVYETYKNDVDGHEQIVCVFDSENGVFKGIIIGNLLGALRTGAIGGVAINELSRMDAEQIAVIGTGLQARTQLEAAVAVRNIKNIRVYSRSHDNRETFAQEMSKKLNTDILPVTSSRDCIEGADIVICATNSFTPVFEIDGLKPGAHINTVGSKSARKHEIPFELAAVSSVIATDSIEQLRAYQTPHFLVGTPDESRVVQLSEIVTGRVSGRRAAGDVTLFCSVGLAGTEIVAANELMKMVTRNNIVR